MVSALQPNLIRKYETQRVRLATLGQYTGAGAWGTPVSWAGQGGRRTLEDFGKGRAFLTWGWPSKTWRWD